MTDQATKTWIVTARHGEPDMDRTVVLSAGDYGEWWGRYQLSGLKPGQEPPESLCDLARKSAVLLSSTLRRAEETARALTDDRPPERHDVFVEAPLPPPPTPWIRLRPKSWGVVSRTVWILGYSGGQETHWAAWRRADQAARMLIGTAKSRGATLLCAHGYFNWMLDHTLRAQGWSRKIFEGSNHYWSYRLYEARGSGSVKAESPIIADVGDR